MRILPASFGPHLINGTIVIVIKKGAWGRLKDIIVIFINSQIFPNEIAGFYFQESCYPFNVILIKNGTCGLATISACKAICLFKNIVMNLVKNIIDPSRILPLQTTEKFLVFGRLLFGFGIEFS